MRIYTRPAGIGWFGSHSTRCQILAVLLLALVGCSEGSGVCPVSGKGDQAPSAGCLTTSAEGLLLVQGLDSRVSLPGGSSRPGESAQCTAFRETWEETGLQLQPRELLQIFSTGFHLYRCERGELSGEIDPPPRLEVQAAFYLPTGQFDRYVWRYEDQKELLRLMLSSGPGKAKGDQIATPAHRGMHMKPLIIGHRGASGHTPEHTLHAYRLAVAMGAEVFEPDLVITKDGILIVRHENEISETTDVAEVYPDRRTVKVIDGKRVEGFFTEDFTIDEIRKLKARERLSFRNQGENGLYSIPTFEEVLQLRAELSQIHGQEIGIAPELKHSTYFKSINLPLEDRFIELIRKHRLAGAGAPVMVQSFEVSNLKYLRKKLPHIQLVQLLDEVQERPADQVAITYGDMATEAGMEEIARYADWISPWKPYIIPFDPDTKQLLKPTRFIELAHGQGLKVVPYTFRNEDQFLSIEDQGRPEQEYWRFFQLGVDAVFSDYPDTAVAVRSEFLKNKKSFTPASSKVHLQSSP